MRPRALGVGILITVLGAFIPAPVSADCQGGPVWPSLDRARGTTFVGVFEGATTTDETFGWTVEHVHAGPLHTGPLDDWGIGGGCHPTKYREGTRYLVSSRFPGGADAFDTVAYELLGGGRVLLAPYPGQPSSSAPAVYHVDTFREALRLLALGTSPGRPWSGSGPSLGVTPEDEASDDLFALSIGTDSPRVVAGAPIPIRTTLRYLGDERATLAAAGTLVAFAVEQLDGPVDTGPAWRPSCGFYEFEPGEVRVIPFAKSGGSDADDPMAAFWRTWFADPVLRLPQGHYAISAYMHHGRRSASCGGRRRTLKASVAIEVTAPPPASPSDGSEAPATADVDASASGTEWGPLAVISEGGAPDAGLGPGTLSIGADCVALVGDRTDAGVTLVWPSDQTSWQPSDRRIVFEHPINGTTRLAHGDRVMFGGQGLGGDSPEVAQQVAAWLEEAWVQRPDASCPTALWHVGEVRMVPRVELVNPEAPIRGAGRVSTVGGRAVAARDDFAGVYVDHRRGGLPVFLFDGDLDSAIDLLRGRIGDDRRFEVREVARSRAELDAIRRAILDASEVLDAQGVRIVEVGTDVRRNQVFVGVLGRVDKASALLSEHADARAFRVEKVGRPETG